MPLYHDRRSFLAGASALALALPVAGSDKPTRKWDDTTDIVVVGSGAGGCVAAAAALAAGAKVVVCEKAGFVGGTTAKSGGAFWIPNNFDLRARGVPDPKADFLRYAARYSYPTVYDSSHPTLGLPDLGYRLIEAYYDYADEMVQHLAALGALQSMPYMSFDGVNYMPDYQDHYPENVTPRGRQLGPKKKDGTIGSGKDLIAQLSAFVRQAGAQILLDSPVTELVQEPGREVTGVVVRTEGGPRSIRARRGVIFCTGGYSQNRDLVRAYQPDPIVGRCALPTSTGDFIHLATRAGAQLGNMSSAWRVQCVLEQALRYQSVPDEVWYCIGDSSLVVNRFGRRCFNERANYHDRTRHSYMFDATLGEYPNVYSFYVYDRRTAERYAGLSPLPDEPLGEPYVICADSLDKLAAELDTRLRSLAAATGGLKLDPSFLPTFKETVTRFNGYAREGHDPEFGRGRLPFDAAWQQDEIPVRGTQWPPNPYPNPVLHPLSDTGPYYAIILGPAVLDTNGGPVIDPTGAVLDTTGQPIPGLYGAGNCIASPAVHAYWGPGATIGNAMTFGYLAARSAAARQPA